MPNIQRTNNHTRHISPYVNIKVDLRSKKGSVHSLLKRLKDKEQKKNKEKFVFMFMTISILVISGIIISF